MILVPPLPPDMPLDDQIAIRRKIESSLVFTCSAVALGWIADSLDRAAGGPLADQAENIQRRLGEIISELGTLAHKAMESKKDAF